MKYIRFLIASFLSLCFFGSPSFSQQWGRDDFNLSLRPAEVSTQDFLNHILADADMDSGLKMKLVLLENKICPLGFISFNDCKLRLHKAMLSHRYLLKQNSNDQLRYFGRVIRDTCQVNSSDPEDPEEHYLNFIKDLRQGGSFHFLLKGDQPDYAKRAYRLRNSLSELRDQMYGLRNSEITRARCFDSFQTSLLNLGLLPAELNKTITDCREKTKQPYSRKVFYQEMSEEFYYTKLELNLIRFSEYAGTVVSDVDQHEKKVSSAGGYIHLFPYKAAYAFNRCLNTDLPR